MKVVVAAFNQENLRMELFEALGGDRGAGQRALPRGEGDHLRAPRPEGEEHDPVHGQRVHPLPGDGADT